MIKNKLLIGIVGMMVLGMSGIRAQESPTTLTLSLEQAQQYAVEHNYALQNASLEVKKAEASKWQTFASMLPQVKAGFDYQNMCGYEMNLGGRGGSMSSVLPDSICIGGR